jgi:hypothetical protein
MNYRDFFKNKKTTAKDIQNLIPEGVDPKEFQKGIIAEIEHTQDQLTAAIIAGKNLKADAHYYSKIQEHCGYCGEDDEGCGECEEGSVEEHCGACQDDMGNEEEMGSEYDDNNGLPKIGGALAVPHHGQPIMMGKIIQVGKMSGTPATGELSGMTNVNKAGVAKDRGGIPANQPGDKEPITAGGKKNDSSIASKSVGGAVVPGEGQKQGGPNHQGTIANTAKLDENKEKVREIVKEVLKEIKFDKDSGKWMKINEGKHKSGCKCVFCANKGSFGKKSKSDDKKEDMDENTVDMKMGPSHKVVQPRLYKTSEDDFARTNEYEPEISEMYDDEEECMMNERYVELANAQRNLTESELAELKILREKIDKLSEANVNMKMGPSYKVVQPTLAKTSEPDQFSRTNEYDPEVSEEMELDEKKKKFLQKAIKPSHKGYCTPMSKPTCTPRRKALAKRLKPGGDLYKGSRDEGVEEGKDVEEVGGQIVQHRSYRTVRDVPQNPKARWSDEIDEVGGHIVQHRSYSTINDAPQNSEARWSHEVDEGSKPSKVVKSIQKGMKPKTTLKNPKLKFQKAKKTTSGVHKRKP